METHQEVREKLTFDFIEHDKILGVKYIEIHFSEIN